MRKLICDIPIDWLDHATLIETLKQFVASGMAHQITTVNPEFVVQAQTDPTFKTVLQASDLSVPDGTGIVLAQTFYDHRNSSVRIGRLFQFWGLGIQHMFFPHIFHYKRITGVELTDILLKLSLGQGWRVFLLGAAPGVADAAAAKWRAMYGPQLQIVGTSSANPDDPAIIPMIQQAQPHILLVAYGAPKQDLFIATHKPELNVPIMVGVGGTFDYAAGKVKLASSQTRTHGLEWLFRLIQQPKRFSRIYRAVFGFSWLVVSSRGQGAGDPTSPSTITR